ncbi:MAG: hypothetical protein QOI82_1885 [Actinomycetota bacterium]|nr:hypothetical protein [Actinomycetota bacterium]
MVTSARAARRLAHAAVALAVAGPAVLLGGVAWADDPTPAPADASATEAPVVQPSIGTWIVGGTLLEGTAAAPAKPVAKPAVQPAAKPAAPTTHVTTRTTSAHHTTTSTAPDGATALPFTGNHVDALLPVGVTLLVGGVVLTLAARPRRVVA